MLDMAWVLTTMVLAILVTLALPLLPIVFLLAVAGWRARRREAEVERQIRLTDAIGAELGAVVAPVVRRRAGGRWRVVMAVPMGRPALVGRILDIAHRALGRMAGDAYEIVLVPQAETAAPAGSLDRGVRQLRAA